MQYARLSKSSVTILAITISALLSISACSSSPRQYSFEDRLSYSTITQENIVEIANKSVPNQTFDERMAFPAKLRETADNLVLKYGTRYSFEDIWSMVKLKDESQSVEKYSEPGFYPAGYFDILAENVYIDSFSFKTLEKFLSDNRDFFISIKNAQPSPHFCLRQNYKACIKMLSESLVVTTALQGMTLGLPQKDIHGRYDSKWGQAKVAVYRPYIQGHKNRSYFVTLFFDPRTEKVEAIQLNEPHPNAMYSRTMDDFESTSLYEIFSTLGNSCPEKGDFYKFLYSFFSRSHTSGREYDIRVSSAMVTQDYQFKAKPICGFKLSYNVSAGSYADTYSRTYGDYQSQNFWIAP